MKREILLLIDYKDCFGSKVTARPYRSGFDKEKLSSYFQKLGYSVQYLSFSEINFLSENVKDKIILYTSSEDKDLYYKQYINDVLFYLDLKGAILIPDYKYFLAHDDKVFMELLRKELLKDKLKSYVFGTLEELELSINKIDLPAIIKPAKGSMSRGVFLVKSENELLNKAKKISYTPSFFRDIKDFLRQFKYSSFKRESLYRKKFIVQELIPNLDHDWKVLVYGDKYYVLKRQNRKNDFRASGSGLLSFVEVLPEGLLDFSREILLKLNVPTLSLDIASDGKNFFLLEFQAIYFGTYTIEESLYYFIRVGQNWKIVHSKSVLEEEYANSIDQYIGTIIH